MSALPNLYDLLHSGFLHCPVCTNTYKDPVILPCLHSACQTCVQRHLDDTGNRQCPICQEHISHSEDNGHRPSIPPNHFLVSLHSVIQYAVALSLEINVSFWPYLDSTMCAQNPREEYQWIHKMVVMLVPYMAGRRLAPKFHRIQND